MICEIMRKKYVYNKTIEIYDASFLFLALLQLEGIIKRLTGARIMDQPSPVNRLLLRWVRYHGSNWFRGRMLEGGIIKHKTHQGV